jgi:tetratricopeptide (TPR) repeat protein
LTGISSRGRRAIATTIEGNRREAAVYRFEDIEVDPSRGCIRRGGQERHLRQQSFHLLLYMLERPQALIRKEDLVANFWQGAAVTDNAVVQCIKEIRKVLGDDPREPRFIKTIHKIGYRFIAPVSAEPCLAQAAEAAVAPQPAAPPRNRRWRLPVAVLAALASIVLASAELNRLRAPRIDVTLPTLPGKHALAVMYFENQGARPDLNWLGEGLADMFITDLAHFGRLTVLSREQLHLLLARAGRRSTNGIPLDYALEIARKSHAQEVLLGSFGALGDKILVNVRLFETRGGALLSADRFVVDEPADLLTQVDVLSPKLAARLGAASAGPAPGTGLAGVMTSNLEAYRYYSLGVGKAQAFQNAQAVALLRKAIQLDPKFAMAYARIGYAYSVTDFLPEKGLPFLAKAFELSDRLTAKDRLYVTAWYAIARRDYPGAIRTLQRIVEQYPNEIEAYTRLARLLNREERPQETLAVVRRALAVDPDYPDLYNVLGVCYLGLERYDEAIAAHQRYVQLAPEEPNAHDSLGMSYQQSGSYGQALAEYNAALAEDPEFEPAIIHLGDVYFQQGRYREALAQYQRYIRVTRSDTARAVGYGSIARVYLRKRDLVRAEQAARNENRCAPGAVWNLLLVALERKDTAAAARLKAAFLHSAPYPARGSRNELRSSDYDLGMLALRQRQPEKAVAHFQAALRHLPPSSGMDLYEDCLAGAYLDLGRLDEAIAEYQRILRLNPNYPLAQFHLAEACARKGQAAQARAAYARFLEIWNNADADIPEVVQARKAVGGR